jgi:signal transduction histidine kinase/CheY-like chemotaxis protein
MSEGYSAPIAAQSGFNRIPIGRLMLASMLVWSLLVGISLSWNMVQLKNQAIYLATEEARANWNKDQAFRRWATRHGGLYVKPDARTPPSPFLAHLPKRDIVTTDGTKLTLMNPAYMMRQMTEEFEDMYGIKGSITGQILLNPINKADPWELQALKRFDLGEKEIVEVDNIAGAPFLRLMRPMIMREGCVKCHGHLGFKVGDIRGGVSVSIPLSSYIASTTKTIWVVAITHAGVWLLGLLGIIYAVQRSKRFEKERLIHEQAIKDIATGVSTATGESFYQHLVLHVASIFKADYVFIGLLNKNNPGLVNTQAVCAQGKITDNIEYLLKDTPCSNVINQQACAYPANVQKLFPKDKMLKQMNAEGYIGKSLRNSRGEALGLLAVLNNKPLKRTEQMSELLEIFSSRASAESERLLAEQALRRSQKMDAIGQLSGGIAHDFNNKLGIILGYLDFIKENVENDKQASKWVETATNATLHCTDLTRQLLSFSRTQGNEKNIVDINEVMGELKTMFARSITPAIEIEYFLSEKLWLTDIHPGEFQDAVLNLVINSRDSMPKGGKIIIETSNIYLDADFAALNVNAQAGNYIQLMLSDNGCGMDKVAQERIFEPFFTTKPKGKGTGLGMSMVYGFVKRYGGFIKVYSEINEGTTIRMYLPRSSSSACPTLTEYKTEIAPRGKETILIVDDEVDLLYLADKYLTSLGYKTYLAENASQALLLLEKHEEIECLFSDVVMPGGINGYDLAQQATEKKPQLKVLLTSGFTSKTISKSGEARFAAQLLSKPYRKIGLAKRIRLVLNSEYTV